MGQSSGKRRVGSRYLQKPAHSPRFGGIEMRLPRPLLFPLFIVGFLLSSVSVSLASFNAVFSRDGVDVWAVGAVGAAWRSFDGGNTWTSRTLGPETLRGI